MSLSRILLTIVLLPLAGFLVNGLLGKRLSKRAVTLTACASTGLAALLQGLPWQPRDEVLTLNAEKATQMRLVDEVPV